MEDIEKMNEILEIVSLCRLREIVNAILMVEKERFGKVTIVIVDGEVRFIEKTISKRVEDLVK